MTIMDFHNWPLFCIDQSDQVYQPVNGLKVKAERCCLGVQLSDKSEAYL